MTEPRVTPPDAADRERALDPRASFAVQAPAGSGKTTLLTQRYLALLATVARPEAVYAITFTQKAAAEMRERVHKALARAAAGAPPEHPADAVTLRHAAAVLAQSRALGWSLEEQPARLRIQTIDALNHWLATRLPVLSRAGVGLAVETRPAELYALAAERTLAALEDGGALAEAVATVLAHADNDVERVRDQLLRMLATRERWLRIVVATARAAEAPQLRTALEASLAEQIGAALAAAAERLPVPAAAELVRLAVGAATRLAAPDDDDRALAAAPPWPWARGAEALPAWRALARLLLTEQGELRKTVNVRQGFPPAAKADKAAIVALLARLAGDERLTAALDAVRALPPPRYPEAEWRVLSALHTVLLGAAARLQQVFAERGRVDFVAVARAALQALGTPEEPTDLTLALDERVEHILVDEFQDTSAAQVALIERLTAGWQPGDGRTLFLVGDPMQSIYGFREANVSLFLEIRAAGLGALRPEPLALEANFRSRPALVDWFNAAFAAVLPPVEDLARGAVRHVASRATRPPAAEPAVHLEMLPDATAADEAERVAAVVARELADPEARIVVLGRGRPQLTPVANALRARGIAYQGVDLVPLGERLAVRDLIALARALTHFADRIAWLAVLRAPWSGLALESLWALVGDTPSLTVWEALGDDARLDRLAPEARARACAVRAVLAVALAERGRRSLASVVEAAWLALGGPATLADAADLDNAHSFLARLDAVERAGDLDDPAALEAELADLYAAPDADAPARLQLMTVHKAKGLEWDVVIVTGLGRGSGRDDGALLEWLEFARAAGGTGLVLAPDRARSKEEEPLVEWIRGLGEERRRLELDRLLYVAATRAKERLYLVGHLNRTGAPGAFARPRSDTLLGRLWPAIEPAATAAAAAAGQMAGAAPRAAAASAPLLRLAPGWRAPPPRAAVVALADATRPEGPSEFEFEWVTTAARHVGTVVHEELERAATTGLAHAAAAPDRAAAWRRRLTELGVGPRQLGEAVARVRRALEATAADPRGAWLFDPSHAVAASELELSTARGGRVVAARIDRTFVDRDGVRWIVDFKTSVHEGTDLEAFLDQERLRYTSQLERYAELIASREPGRPIRLGLYFPLHCGWREWARGATPPASQRPQA